MNELAAVNTNHFEYHMAKMEAFVAIDEAMEKLNETMKRLNHYAIVFAGAVERGENDFVEQIQALFNEESKRLPPFQETHLGPEELFYFINHPAPVKSLLDHLYNDEDYVKKAVACSNKTKDALRDMVFKALVERFDDPNIGEALNELMAWTTRDGLSFSDIGLNAETTFWYNLQKPICEGLYFYLLPAVMKNLGQGNGYSEAKMIMHLSGYREFTLVSSSN